MHTSLGGWLPSPKRLAALSACAAVLLPLLVWAQQPSPRAEVQAPAAAGPVSAAGYKLEPVSFSFDKWPTVRFDFNLLNESQGYFDQLKSSDIKAKFENQPVAIEEGALRLTASEPAHAIVLIDGSGSMIDKHVGVNKLGAAKDALRAFIENLRPNDTLSIYAFDAGFYLVAPRTSDKETLQRSINGFGPRLNVDPAGTKYSNYTDLYGATLRALEEAGREKVRCLIVLSDGMQDTRQTRDALRSPDAFEAYKHDYEKRIVELARQNGVRIFTLAIGNKDAAWKHPDNLEYVDADTLNNIADVNTGGFHRYIDMPELGTRAQTSTSSYQTLLEEKLQKSLEKIRQSFYYAYSLELVLHDFPQDGKEHTLEMSFPAGGTSLPTVQYPLSWKQGETLPQTGSPEVFTTAFLPTPGPTVRPISLSAIYVFGLGGLGLLAVIPMALLRVQRVSWVRSQERAVSNSVIAVQKNSPYIGKECPNDPSAPIKLGDVIVVCPRCGRAHHLNCWLYAKSRCMVRYCTGELPIPEVILERHSIKAA